MTTSTLTETRADNQVLHDLQMLQGTWMSVSGRRQAELLFAGHHYTVRFMDGDLYMGTFALSPDGHPRVMEMTIDEGPDNHLGKVARCLYDVAPDALRWCAPEPGATERLGSFPSVQDKRYLSLLFKREQPQPKE
jgi:uncharacterized protein (TIGR03067 family)